MHPVWRQSIDGSIMEVFAQETHEDTDAWAVPRVREALWRVGGGAVVMVGEIDGYSRGI